MRTTISTSQAPAAIGPYAQAIKTTNLLFCSGQIPLDPATGEMVGAGDVASEAHQVLKNLGAVLKAAGCTYGDVLKTTIFLADMQDFATVNGVYAEYFAAEPPARATIAVAGLPKGARVEIEAIAQCTEG